MENQPIIEISEMFNLQVYNYKQNFGYLFLNKVNLCQFFLSKTFGKDIYYFNAKLQTVICLKGTN